MSRSKAPEPRKRRFTIRALMIVILIIAIDAAAYHQAVWHESRLGAYVFLLLTIMLPMGLFIRWLMTKIDWSGNTLY